MPEGNINFSSNYSGFKDTVCITCNKIMDSCRDKECYEDLKVFLTDYSQDVLDKASTVRCKDAEILYTHISVEPVTFNRGFYQCNIRFYFRLNFECCVCLGKSQEIEGIAVADKSVVLFGGESNISTFKSDPNNSACGGPAITNGNINIEQNNSFNLPTATVEVIDPICLGVKVIEKGHPCNCCCTAESIPESIHNSVRGRIIDIGNKDLVVSLGIFALIRLERVTQIVVPCADFCIPEKEATVASISDENPCKVFSKIKFPVDEFYPQPLHKANYGNDFFEKDDKGCKR